MERDDQVKVHYLRYDSSYDEWRECSDVIPSPDVEPTLLCPLLPYGFQIKQALSCGQKQSPVVRIDMPFDLIQFNGWVEGSWNSIKSCTWHPAIQNHFRDLTSLLGSHWHIWGFNENGDYGYVILETVEYHIHKHQPLVKYLPLQSPAENIADNSIKGLCVSIFACGYGTKSTFGKDRRIICIVIFHVYNTVVTNWCHLMAMLLHYYKSLHVHACNNDE